jgi:subfamily B ATP-binding cassette protein MsbA
MNPSKNPLWRLKPYLKPHASRIALILFLTIPLGAITAAPVEFIKRVIDEIPDAKDVEILWQSALIFVGLYVLNFFVRFAHYYLMRIVVIRVNQAIKNDLYQHLTSLSADHFTSNSVGQLMSRVGTDPQYVDGGINAAITMVRETIKFVFLFGFAIYLNWKLTLLVLVVLPPLAWLFSFSGKAVKRYIAKISQESAHIFANLQETFSGVRVIQAFRLEKYMRQKFEQRNENFSQLLLKTSRIEEAAHPGVELLSSFAIAIILVYGGHLILAKEMTPGQLIALFGALALMTNPVRAINDANLKLGQASGACIRIFELFDWKTRLKESPSPRQLTELKTAIRLDSVEFAYPDAPERKILKRVSFEVKRGQTVAIVGPSGAGKSSLISLLPRIFDVTGGSITIDGVDLRDFSLESLRNQIAVVSQDVFLFNDSIRENIRCGKLSATDLEIDQAAKLAHASDFIARLSDGMDTICGDRGQKLSGGEKQRVSIARAFLRGAPILILDEATSSLDTESERIVQAALDDLMKDRTTLVIAHRLSTIEKSDLIIVLDQGEIREMGTHSDLLSRGGDYSRVLALATRSG